jgi:hypothetical protein
MKHLYLKPCDIESKKSPKGRKVERSKGRKVERSKGRKVERSKGRKVERSKGRKVETCNSGEEVQKHNTGFFRYYR